MDPIFVNQILDIFLNHLTKTEHNQLDICTIRTIAQFMIERKNIIIPLLEYALKCQSVRRFLKKNFFKKKIFF
jgi:hypothetical protein